MHMEHIRGGTILEHSCGAVLFTKENGRIEYLLVETNSGHISFPKGHMEAGETKKETAKREIFEETGLRIEAFLDGFMQACQYKTKRGNDKEVTYFLAEFGAQKVRVQKEEIRRWWVLPYEQAIELINKDMEKDILHAAASHLQRACKVR